MTRHPAATNLIAFVIAVAVMSLPALMVAGLFGFFEYFSRSLASRGAENNLKARIRCFALATDLVEGDDADDWNDHMTSLLALEKELELKFENHAVENQQIAIDAHQDEFFTVRAKWISTRDRFLMRLLESNASRVRNAAASFAMH